VSSLRSRFNDGCGVPVASGGVFPPNGAPGGCRDGAPLGVDPSTNRPGDGEVNDSSSSSPAVGPDGAIFYGAFSRYNYDQGHLMKFSASGSFANAYGFGWDQTPAIFKPHDETDKCGDACYSLVIKENHYGNTGSYCDIDFFCPFDRNATNPASPEAYSITQLDQNMGVQWQFKSTNTQSCSRNADGTLSCFSDHPNGFEWCVNGHLVDEKGVVYANSEDGNLYAISQGGILKEKIFQQLALGAAYTPASMDRSGRIYSQNAGHLFVIGR
jgi:outer membrane protein assembly factor BamB